MRLLLLASLLAAPLLTGVTALPSRQDEEATVSYSGYKWHQDAGRLDVLVAPDEAAAFEALGLDYRVMHQDLGTSISAESSVANKKKRQDDPLAWFETYHNYEDHIQYFRDLHDAFPNNSELVSSGKSYQGRDIFGIHLWGPTGPGSRRCCTTGLFMPESGSLHRPSPSWTEPAAAPSDAANATCLGRDINRNWEHGWDSNPRGSSTNPCSQTYRGAAPGDSPENAGLDAFMRQVRDRQGIKLYIDWHSYGQYLLFPFGYAETLYAPELGKWTKAASMISETIRDSSDAATTYTFGASGATLYATSGSAPDHVYSVGRAEWSFTIELRDTGRFGFVLPPEQIRPAAEEMWAGQRVLFALLDETFFDGVGAAQVYQQQGVAAA
ncbi:uncharacterized protein PG986_014066 [Apiospora aurea]|uniref:Peptidase M14 domain-containing protein n=1 Tax=Apiospora aurea TaxID=335848 RepID=A0ABR1PRY2_9PEZI